MKTNSALKKYRDLPRQAKAALWFTICTFLQKGISEITTPIFTRILTTAEYGQYNVFNTWLNFVTVIVVMKLYAGLYTQGLVKYEHDRDAYVSSMQGLSLTLCATWTVIYWCGHLFWNKLLSLTTVQMLAMMLMIWSTSCFNLWATEQRVKLKYKELLIVTILVSTAKPVVGIIFVLNADDRVTARILGLALVELIGYTIFFFISLKRGKKFFSKFYWKTTIALCIPLIPHYLCQTALNSADRIMIKNMVGDSEAGIYSLAYSVSQIMALLNTALVQTVTPWIGQKIKSEEGEKVPSLVYGVLILVALANIGIMAFTPELIKIFGPESYHDAIWVMPPVTMSVFFSFAYSTFAAYEFYFEETKLMSVATMAGAVLNIVLNYIFIKIWGYYAAGYTTLLCFVFYAVFHFLLMQKIIKEKMSDKDLFDVKQLMKIALIFVFVGFVYLASYTNIWARYSLTIVIAVLLFRYRTVVVGRVKEILNVRKKKE